MRKAFQPRLFTTILSIITLFSFYQTQAQVQTAKYNVSINGNSHGFYEYLPQGYDSDNISKKYPLLLFIHGAGDLGDGTASATTGLPLVKRVGPTRLISKDSFPTFFSVNNHTFSFIVISPQFVNWPVVQDIEDVINYCIQNYNVDINRIYLTGLSMGGGMILEYTGANNINANRIAAVVPIAEASWPDYNRARVIAGANLPVWATHNDGDPTVPVYCTNTYIDYINTAPAPSPLARKTIFSGNTHDAWSATYKPTFRENGLNVYEWMLQYHRNFNGNPAPVANAGAQQSVTLPVNQVTMAGSGAPYNGGTITSHIWTKVSGGSATITDPSAYNTTITNLTEGFYTFRLTVTQNDDQFVTSDVNVTVNPPIGSSGKTIPGRIQAEAWDAKSGPQYAVTTNDVGGGQQVIGISNASWMDYNVDITQAGTYTAKFRVATPQQHAQFQIKLNNSLVGTVSIPSTGEWNTWATVSVNNISLTAGTQTIRILSTNTENCNFNWMEFTQDAGGSNPPPVANAGPTQTITSPASEVTLAGSATVTNGSSIIEHIWSKFTGGAATITDPSNYNTTVTGLVVGTYVFRLTVKQNDNQTATSDVTITVNPAAATPPPTANAGTTQTITLPTNQVTLTGNGTANNGGSISEHTWSKFTGGAATITDPSNYNTTVTGLAVGTYVFHLTVKQNDNQTATSDVTITVNPAAATPSPTANAGTTQTITLPTNQVTLAGSGTANNGGSIINHTWSKFSGGAATITDPSDYNTTVTGLAAGTYVFRLTVTQNDNQTATNDVTITVNPAAAIPPPTANAGTTQTITLPTSQVTLAGSGTANNGGSIIEHTWSKFSGGVATITGPSNYNTTVTGLAAGTYVFRLTVKQNDNQTATSDVTITVNPAVIVSGKTIPGKIEAESWDAKSGPFYAVATTDVGGGQQVIGISNGSRMDYNVTITEAGTYTVKFRIATTQVHTQFQIKLGTSLVGTINIPSTGEWNNWATVAVSNVYLSAGTQTLSIISANNENCNFNWMEFVSDGGSGIPPPTANAGAAQNITLPANQITLSGSGTANNGGTITSHTWTKVSGGAATITNSSNYTTTITNLAEGTYVFRLTVVQDDDQTSTSDVTITVNPAIVASGKNIPGKIEAESWDAKSGPFYAVATTDVGGGQQVIGISNGSRMDYNVNVTQAGTYTAKFRIATTQAHTQFQIRLGTSLVGTINIPSTGEWNNWATVAVSNMYLTAGTQTLSILSTNNENCNFNWMEFVLDGGSATPPPTANAGTAQNITLPANQITLAGNGTANNGGTITSHVWTKVSGGTATITVPSSYNTTVTNLAEGTYVFQLMVTQDDGLTASSEVTITVSPATVVSGKTIPGRIEAEKWDAKSGPFYAVATNDVGGGQQVIGINNGSAMDYNVNVTEAGIYTVGFRVATTQAHAQFQIKSGNTVLGTINIPNTGEWSNWKTVTIDNISLPAGNQTLRVLSSNNESCNFNWLEFVSGNPPAANAVTSARTVTQQAIEPETFTNSIELFPNPAIDHFTIKINTVLEGDLKIQIFDQSGTLKKEIKSFKSKGISQSGISIADLPKGVYMIKLQMKDWSKSIKLIK